MKLLLGAAAAALLAGPALAGVVVTYENPGVQNSTATFDFVGVETFDSRSLGAGQTFGTTFGGSEISGTYTNVRIDAANQYGSAGGSGNHAVTFASGGYELSLSTARPEGINYFGYWLSALDRGNKIEFFKGADLVYSFSPTAVDAAIGACPNAANPYCGNPNAPFLGQNAGESYAFINIYFEDGLTIDRIRFFENPEVGGYESDNHTVGYFIEKGGNGVPEPATWAMLVAGFGLVGAAARRRRNIAVTA
jgi:hypothetical protein